jgi:NAD(P)-dependent dehydrogenase (short-subunit alcohol dehydrogenase family)
MDLELSGKTVLVTGASKGIGLAVAEAFAAEGCALHLVARTAADLNAAGARIQAAHDVRIFTHPLDLSRSESVRALAAACPDADILVNNAGAIPGGDLDAIDEARWREAWDLKVFGYVNLTREFHRRMRQRGGGVIVNIIGLAGERMDAGYVAGSSGNASLMAFTRAVGSTSIDHGVRVVGVNPGAVETERLVKLFQTRAQRRFGDPSRWRELFEVLPLKRAAKPAEVADVVVFLASPRAAYISGTIVTVDGGFAARAG